VADENPKDLVVRSDFAILLEAAAAERASVDVSLSEAARIVDRLQGPLLRSFARGCAELHRSAAEAEHRLARAFEALAEESGAEAITRRDVEAQRRITVTGLPLLWKFLMALGGGLTTTGLAGTWGPHWSIPVGGVGTILVGLGGVMTAAPGQPKAP
jgi:hypothetical protein